MGCFCQIVELFLFLLMMKLMLMTMFFVFDVAADDAADVDVDAANVSAFVVETNRRPIFVIFYGAAYTCSFAGATMLSSPLLCILRIFSSGKEAKCLTLALCNLICGKRIQK